MNVDDDDGGRRWQRNHGSMPLNRLQLNKIQRKIIRRIVFDEIVYAMHGYGPGFVLCSTNAIRTPSAILVCVRSVSLSSALCSSLKVREQFGAPLMMPN